MLSLAETETRKCLLVHSDTIIKMGKVYDEPLFDTTLTIETSMNLPGLIGK
jgi:hypothetical protein